MLNGIKIRHNNAVSVIMPVYQPSEVYLYEAIESILKQTHSDFEFLIVSDSPEWNYKLQQIVTSYGEDRIVLVPCTTHGGIAVSSNIGINLAKYPFIAMMDHDDICTPTRLEQQVSFLTQNLDFGFVGGQAEGFYRDGNYVKLNYPTARPKELLKQSFFEGVPFLNPSVMFRKTALNTLRYNSNFKVCADYELFARLVFKYKVLATNLPEVILRYRFHDANTSLNNYLLVEEETNKIQNWIIQETS